MVSQGADLPFSRPLYCTCTYVLTGLLNRPSSISAWPVCSRERLIQFLRSPAIAASSDKLYSNRLPTGHAKDEATPKLVDETSHAFL